MIITYIFTWYNGNMSVTNIYKLFSCILGFYKYSALLRNHRLSSSTKVNLPLPQDVVALVDNTRIHLLPSMNPDGWKIATDAVSSQSFFLSERKKVERKKFTIVTTTLNINIT